MAKKEKIVYTATEMCLLNAADAGDVSAAQSVLSSRLDGGALRPLCITDALDIAIVHGTSFPLIRLLLKRTPPDDLAKILRRQVQLGARPYVISALVEEASPQVFALSEKWNPRYKGMG